MGSGHDGLIIPPGGRGQKMSVSRLAVISSGQALRLSVRLPPPLPPPTPSVSCPALWLKSLLSLSHRKFAPFRHYDLSDTTRWLYMYSLQARILNIVHILTGQHYDVDIM